MTLAARATSKINNSSGIMTAAGGRADQRGQEYMMLLLNMGTREVRNQKNNPNTLLYTLCKLHRDRAGVR